MNTAYIHGVKNVIRKLIRQFNNPSRLHTRIDSMHFPDTAVPRLFTWAKMRGLESELHGRVHTHSLGSLYTLPHPAASDAYRRFIAYNPGNLGSWSDKKNISATQKIESEVIHKLINLLHGTTKTLGGYITSGGTEGNIFSAWTGRAFLLRNHAPETLCVIKTSLSHYSIRKAADICNLQEWVTPLDAHGWNMDPTGLTLTVRQLYKRGYRGFLIPLTLGYTVTGTSDDIGAITHELTLLKKQFPDTDFYVWIDAALNGLIEPFINPSFSPFIHPFVQTIILDFHKFGLVPYPAGIVIHDKTLPRFIKKPIEYLAEDDTTLLGSRSGIPAISIWNMIHIFGKKGYAELAKKQLHAKNIFISEVSKRSDKFEVVTHKNSISCGIIYHGRGGRLPKWVENKYNLYLGKSNLLFAPHSTRSVGMYKCFFLPHISIPIAREFADDLSSLKEHMTYTSASQL